MRQRILKILWWWLKLFGQWRCFENTQTRTSGGMPCQQTVDTLPSAVTLSVQVTNTTVTAAQSIVGTGLM